jgi:hypothetical protein
MLSFAEHKKPEKMKKLFLILVIIISVSLSYSDAQKVYPVTSGALLFQFANVELANSEVTSTPPRFTMFFHWGQYYHFDVVDNLGFYTGLAVRNVGFIYDEDIPQKTVRRSYTLGVPLALKLGSFKNHLYIFGGGEYEMLFHYKAKRWYSNERKGSKVKDSEWFSNKTELFVPSVFAGLQFPKGFNIKFKYYLGDFLNLDYTGPDLGESNVSFSDFTKLEMFYISVCWQFRTDKARKYVPVSDEKMVLRDL